MSWNTVPNRRDAIIGVRHEPSETVFGTVVYHRYSSDWKRPMRNLPPGSGDNDVETHIEQGMIGNYRVRRR